MLQSPRSPPLHMYFGAPMSNLAVVSQSPPMPCRSTHRWCAEREAISFFAVAAAKITRLVEYWREPYSASTNRKDQGRANAMSAIHQPANHSVKRTCLRQAAYLKR